MSVEVTHPILTKEERDALILVALHPNSKFQSNREISEQLGISVISVKSLLHQACVKLGADNRGEAVFLALRRGEILITEFFTLSELANCLSALGPELLMLISKYINQDLGYWQIERKFNKIILANARQETILTNRERDVLIHVGRSLANKEIAEKLFISTSAVRNFLYRACAKLGVHRSVDAFLLALKTGEIAFTEIFTLDDALQVLTPLGTETIESLAELSRQKLNRQVG